jgi:hypothetical protein
VPRATPAKMFNMPRSPRWVAQWLITAGTGASTTTSVKPWPSV